MAEPEETFRVGGIQASVFVNVRKIKGEEVELRSVSFQKRYKSGDEWKSTNSLDPNDIPKAMLVLLKAYDYIVDRQAQRAEDEIELTEA